MEADVQRVETLFDAALELPADERPAYLDRECGADAAVRVRVERLLAAHARAGRFFGDCRTAMSLLDPGAPGEIPGEGEIPGAEAELGKHIGPYKLLEKIGEGGCGAVYLAQQDKPVRRRVALKIIKLGMDTKSVIARFEAERQALAMMDHPNIARVLDAGATETGRPYFVMEVVPGIRITEYCDQQELDTRQRLDLFIQVCHAIQHAHQKGIIHRDIKPSNILVTQSDGVPVPKVIDFGIAKAMADKLTDKTLFTICGNFIGTPAYMSPEQADFSGLDIDTRSDIYSLGVLLYELLTGRPPFEQEELLASGLDEMRKTLREREPHRPSTRLDTFPPGELTTMAQRRHIEAPRLQLLLRGDLDWIVMKALEKDRRRRYETANGLAMDVRRFLDHEPVLARSPSRWYRFQKMVRRNRGVFAAAGAVALALMIGLGTATWMFYQERAMRHRAMAAEQLAEEARANEAALRRLAETREKITQTAFLISQGKLADADQVAAQIVFQQPTLEGAAVLRSLGEWHALNSRWQVAGDRFLQALQADQLDSVETASLDYLRAGAALATAGDTRHFALFRQKLADRFAAEKNPDATARALLAALLLPAPALAALHPLQATIAATASTCIGNRHLPDAAALDHDRQYFKKLKLLNVGPQPPAAAIQFNDDDITLVSGGADIWFSRDGFGYACALLAGDFDFRMQVVSIKPKPDPYTRVGLMARELADQPDSRHVMVSVTATNTFQVVMRSQVGASATSVPQDPLPRAYGSNSWVRLQRVGAIFHAYTSQNGVDWTQLYQTTGGDKPFSDPIYFGLAAAAHSSRLITTNVVCHFGQTPTVSTGEALTLALWEYRAGQGEAAANWCRRLLVYPESGAAETATARVILALACQQMNRPDEGRRQMEMAGDLIEKKFSGGLDAGSKTDGFWYDWVMARSLLAEARNQ